MTEVSRTGWCPTCAASVPLLDTAAVAEAAGVATETVFEWIETGRFHVAETPDGVVGVCVLSLADLRSS